MSLLTLAGARYAWSRGRSFRLSEPVHLPVVEQAGAGLAATALAKGEWNRDRDGARSLVPAHAQPRASTGARHWIDRAAAELGAAVEVLLRENEDSPAWDVIDRDHALAQASRFGSLREGERRQLLGALTSVIWMNGAERGAREEWVS